MKNLSLPSLGTVLLLAGCSEEPMGGEKSTTYASTSMGDTPCEPLRPGLSEEAGQLSGIFILGGWAERVRDVLVEEGVTVKMFPNDFDPLVCYGSDEVTPQEDGLFVFNFEAPVTNRGEEWNVTVVYPEAVYDTYEAGYTDGAGQHFENWELACFDQASDSRPADNYGYIVDETYSSPGSILSVDGAPEGWDCDLRFIAR